MIFVLYRLGIILDVRSVLPTPLTRSSFDLSYSLDAAMPTASLAGLRGLATAMHPIVSHAGKFLIGLPVAYTIMCQIGGPCKVRTQLS